MKTMDDMLYARGRMPVWQPRPDHPPYTYRGIGNWQRDDPELLERAHRVARKDFLHAIERIEAKARGIEPRFKAGANITVNRCLLHDSTAVWQPRAGAHPYFYCGNGNWSFAMDGEALLSASSSVDLRRFHQAMNRTDRIVEQPQPSNS